MRRADFEEAGGFDEEFRRAEDIDLGVRLARAGCRFVFNDRAIGWHYAERSLASWLRIPKEYARTDVMIDRRYPDLRYASTVKRELARRHPAQRVMIRATRAAGLSRPLIQAAAHGARASHRIGARRLTRGLLSYAYAASYVPEFEAALLRADAPGPVPDMHSRRETLDRASTGTPPAAPKIVD
jgi:GT2 family glycosyltransferase